MIKVRLKEILKKRQMTMTELHNKTGISKNALSLLANGKSNGIQFNTLEKIMTITDCSIDELLQHVGEQYNFHVEPIKKSSELENPEIHNYKIIATDLEQTEYNAKLSFRLSVEKLNGRKVVLVSYVRSTEGFPNQFLNDFFFTAQNKGLLKIVSYLIATDLLLKLGINNLPLNSLVMFTWFGFTPSDKGELVYSLPIEKIDKDTLPNVNVLEDEEYVDEIMFDRKTKRLSISAFIK